jgi:hypothetical protein
MEPRSITCARIRHIAEPRLSKAAVVLAFLIADGRSCHVLPRRAFDEQPPDALPVIGPEPPEEEPLDLAQPLVGFQCREEGWGWAGVAWFQDSRTIASVAEEGVRNIPQ